MKHVLWRGVAPAALVATLGLAACTPPHPHVHIGGGLKTIARLDCPTEADDLKLTSAAADGRSCLYAGPAGEQANLQLIDLKGGDASAALEPLTADLRSELPATAGKSDADEKDNVDIDLPGVHIHAHDNPGAPPMAPAAPSASNAAAPASANSASASSVTGAGGTSVHVGDGEKGVVINAGENGAEIHISRNGDGVRMTFILASETPGPHGYKFVGYEARGPEGGPIAVASVMARDGDHDDLRHALGRLLKRNVGG